LLNATAYLRYLPLAMGELAVSAQNSTTGSLQSEEPSGVFLADPRRRKLVVLAIVFVLLILAIYSALRLVSAADAAVDGKNALIAAQEAMETDPANSEEAHRQLEIAKAAFDKMGSSVNALGPIHPVLRIVPLVRVQMRAVDEFQDAGELLSVGGLELVDAYEDTVAPDQPGVKAAQPLEFLEEIHRAVKSGADRAEDAVAGIESLNGKRLFGPLGGARDELLEKLSPIAGQARNAEHGIAAMRTFFGQRGNRRYLVFSQNPQELRPTGGYLGAFSVLGADGRGLKVESTSSVETWLTAHPGLRIKEENLAGVFQFSSAPTLANVNYVPDWGVAGRFASSLWTQGGEQPVDGVLGITPGFLRKILSVTGPLTVPEYNEVVSEANLNSRFEFHTRQVALRLEDNVKRKGFAAQVAASALHAALELPRSKWRTLATALGTSFDAREAMIWSRDASVALAAAERRWDGVLPEGEGDFFYDGEFSFGAKNGRALKRTFDHHVKLNSDGSGVVTTKVTVFNPVPQDRLNPNSLVYATFYGPAGARFSTRSTNVVNEHEPTLSGHPGAGFFMDPQTNATDTTTIVWAVPKLGVDRGGGTWNYDLRFMRVPDHTGDVLNLTVELPKGWKWRGAAPPKTTNLDKDLVGSWAYGK
jgi:hypothetical protein